MSRHCFERAPQWLSATVAYLGFMRSTLAQTWWAMHPTFCTHYDSFGMVQLLAFALQPTLAVRNKLELGGLDGIEPGELQLR
mmetsp:Transcript_77871/g.150437  ORF Transcript_77871/g.150437 Transcript_77871/m.150437 type:complete len:82 (+) Transcript_77871:513-758(+)